MKPSSRRIRNGLVVTIADPKQWVLVQYLHCVPYTISRKEWDSLPHAPKPPTEKQKAVIRRVLFGREPKPKKESK